MPANTAQPLRPWPDRNGGFEPPEMSLIKGEWSNEKRLLLKQAWQLGSDPKALAARMRDGTEAEVRKKARWKRRMLSSESVTGSDDS